MPRYSTHKAVNLTLGLPFAYFGLNYQALVHPNLVMTACVAFIFGTIMLSPDLDLRQSIPTRNWGVFGWIWRGYHRLFKHRGKSHSYIFGSASKIVYLLIVLSFLLSTAVLAYHLYFERSYDGAISQFQKDMTFFGREAFEKCESYKYYLIASAFGIVVSDWIHIFSDRFVSFLKRV